VLHVDEWTAGLLISNHAIEEAYKALKNGEPQTPNEITEVIGTNQKTVQIAPHGVSKHEVRCQVEEDRSLPTILERKTEGKVTLN
jgi:hypothetical protein